MAREGWMFFIFVLIALGLVLKFGGSSNAILGTGFKGLLGETDALLMTGTAGNNPPGVHTA